MAWPVLIPAVALGWQCVVPSFYSSTPRFPLRCAFESCVMAASPEQPNPAEASELDGIFESAVFTESEDAEIDAMVRREIELAFAGVQESFASGDDDAALEAIQASSKQVLQNVLEKFDADGEQLTNSINTKVWRPSDRTVQVPCSSLAQHSILLSRCEPLPEFSGHCCGQR